MQIRAYNKGQRLYSGTATLVEIDGVCALGCGATVTYLVTIAWAGCSPDVSCNGTAYAGGHLCGTCRDKVDAIRRAE